MSAPCGRPSTSASDAPFLRPFPSMSVMPAAEEGRSLYALLSEVVQAANSTLDESVILELIMEKIRLVVEAEAWSILMVEGDRLVFSHAEGQASESLHGVSIPLDRGIAGRVAVTGEAVIVNEPEHHPDFLSTLDHKTGFRTRNLMAIPLRARSGVLGVVELVNREGGFDREDLEKACLFLDPLAMALDNAILFRRTQELTVTDDLTGLYNSRYIVQTLHQEVQRCLRYEQVFSLLFIDLDGFKAVNDTHGHLVGSRTLTAVGKIIRASVREVDSPARYGGDEFCVILPNTEPEDAVVVAHRIRDAVRTHDWRNEIGHAISISASVGVAGCPRHGRSAKEILAKADTAMYKVKEAGKNGVVMAEEDEA